MSAPIYHTSWVNFLLITSVLLLVIPALFYRPIVWLFDIANYIQCNRFKRLKSLDALKMSRNEVCAIVFSKSFRGMLEQRYCHFLAKLGFIVVLIGKDTVEMVELARNLRQSYGVLVRYLVVDIEAGISQTHVYQNIEKSLEALSVGLVINTIHPATHAFKYPATSAMQTTRFDSEEITSSLETIYWPLEIAPVMLTVSLMCRMIKHQEPCWFVHVYRYLESSDESYPFFKSSQSLIEVMLNDLRSHFDNIPMRHQRLILPKKFESFSTSKVDNFIYLSSTTLGYMPTSYGSSGEYCMAKLYNAVAALRRLKMTLMNKRKH